MIYLPSVIFGQTTRTLFKVNGEPAVWVQDVFQSPGYEIQYIRYTTWNDCGMMSVYRQGHSEFTADSDRTILCDEHGNPTTVTGIQRYLPAPGSVFCPVYLEVGETWFHSTEGDWSHCAGDNYPGDWPMGRYRHDNAWCTDGVHVYHDEEFFYQRAASPMSPPYWELEYRRGFVYEIETRWLIQFTDYRENETRVYERS